MTAPKYRARRATTDDLGALTTLWKTMGFDAAVLARHVTEFQVVETPDGELVGAIGLNTAERQGRIHSEGFIDYGAADAARPVLWERLQSLAANHGLLRFWTREEAPFWHQRGLEPPDEAALQALPKVWAEPNPGWRTLKLRDDVEALLKADAELALFMQREKEQTQRTMRQARVFKTVVTVIALVVFVLAVAAAFYLFQRNRSLLGR